LRSDAHPRLQRNIPCSTKTHLASVSQPL
jgi:hypothetical protein